MDRTLESLSDEELGLLLYRSAAVLAQAANLQKQDPQLKNAALVIQAAADPLKSFDELERANPELAESVLSAALATLAQGKTMYSARKEMKRRVQERN